MIFKNKTILLIQAFITFSLFTISSAYIECYKCPLEPTNEIKEFIDCLSFDESRQFKVQCEKSTYCEKKITHLTIPNGTTIERVIYRGCAPQNDPRHQLENQQWELKDNIQMFLYEPGCFKGIDKNSPTGPATYCRCKTHYCNGVSSKIGQTFNIFLLAFVTSYFL